jgi:hypothetical protein
MTRKNKSQPAALDRLTDALLEDIFATSDADLLAEAQADGDDGEAVGRRAFERASRTVALNRLSWNKDPAHSGRLTPANIRALDPKTARSWLDKFVASDPETASQLNDAADRGNELSDDDVYGILEVLQERGVLERRTEHRRG